VLTTVPNVEKLKPLDDVAIHFFLRVNEVEEILQNAGVQILYLSVSRKRIALANESEAYAAIAQQLLIDANSPPARPLMVRFEEQAAELETLKRQVEALQAARSQP